MSIKNLLLPVAILVFAVGGVSIAQNKATAPRAAAIAEPAAAPQTPAPAAQASAAAKTPPPQTPAPPAPPQEPRAWSFAFGGDNYLGISAEPVTSENQNTYGAREARGVGVRSVVEGGPAEKAGLRKNDVILRFDNEPVTSIRKLNRLVDEAEPGHTAQLTVSRGGAEQQIAVTLGHRENQASRVFRTGPGGAYRLDRNAPGFNMVFSGGGRQIGIGTSPLTKQLGEYFGVPEGGVLVSNVNENSPAARAGIKAGDIIVEVDGKKIDSSRDLVRAIGEKNEGDVNLTVVRNRNRQTIRVTPEKREWKSGAFGDHNFRQLSELEGSSDFELPEIDIPEFTVPEINVPEIDVPEIDLPDIDLSPLQQIENIQIPKVIVAPKIQKIRVAPVRIAPIRIAPIRIPPIKIDPITIL